MYKDTAAKYPKLGSKLDYFKEVWAETFPNSDVHLNNKMARRKQLARMQREAEEREKEMTPEELEEYEKSIPEWKKGALVATGETVKEEKKGVFGKLKDRIGSTEAGKKFIDSEEYEKLKDVRSNYQEFKDNLKDGMENS